MPSDSPLGWSSGGRRYWDRDADFLNRRRNTLSNADWAWDQFDLSENQGQLDLSNDDYLRDQDLGLSRDWQQTYETWFIDDMYGTEGAQWTGDNLPYRDGTGEGILDQTHRHTGKAKGIVAGYGLDLVRDWSTEAIQDAYGKDSLEIGSPEHYEWMTRGSVNWEYYADSPQFQDAFDTLKQDNAWSWLSNYNSTEFLTDWHGNDTATYEQRIEFIREAKRLGNAADEDEKELRDREFWDTWDNQYDPRYHHSGPNEGQPIDPEAAYDYTPTALFDPATKTQEIANRLQQAKLQETNHPGIIDSIKTPSPVTSMPSLVIETVNIERPSNIPAAWGED